MIILGFLPPQPLETPIQQFQPLVPTSQKGFTIRNNYYTLSEIIFGQWLEKSVKQSTTSGLKRLTKLVSISAAASMRFIAPFYLKVCLLQTGQWNSMRNAIMQQVLRGHFFIGKCSRLGVRVSHPPKRSHKSQLRWLPRWAFQAAFSTLEVWATCQ